MSSETFIVAYEGEEGDTPTLDYAIERARKDGAGLLVVHILEWSPYSFLTPDEIEERHGRRKQEMTRAREIVLDPAVAKVKAAGLVGSAELRYGNVVDKIVRWKGDHTQAWHQVCDMIEAFAKKHSGTHAMSTCLSLL